jgi:hypothetical protein
MVSSKYKRPLGFLPPHGHDQLNTVLHEVEIEQLAQFQTAFKIDK